MPNPLEAAAAVANTVTSVIITDINIPIGLALITKLSTRCAVAAASVLPRNAKNKDFNTVVPIVNAPTVNIVP